jgi:hypothetical protein
MTDQKLRMDAYYYGFDPTGAPEIDLILSAVACAGKSFHHTDQWNEQSEPWPAHTGNSPAEWIQNAAIIAADGNKQASAEIARLQAENEELVTALNEILRVTPMGVEAFGIAALVLGELGVSKEASQ